MKNYVYAGGQEVMVNDLVLAPVGRFACVQELLEPGSSHEDAKAMPNGGVLLGFGGGKCQMWPRPENDLYLVRRFILPDTEYAERTHA